MRVPTTALHLAALGLVLAGGLLAAPLSAQEAPASPGAVVVETAPQLEQLYRELYELQIEIARVGDEGRRRALELRRAALLERIAQLKASVPSRPRPPAPPGANAGEFTVLLDSLAAIGSRVDWEEFAEQADAQLEQIGQHLGVLAEEFQGMQFEVNGDQIRLNNPRSGSQLHFRLPPELGERARDGLIVLEKELARAFADSGREGGGLEAFLENLPEGARRLGILAPRPRERRVIGETVFRFWDDFEVAYDEVVAGDLYVVGGSAFIAGEVQGNVIVAFGDILVEDEGVVARDAVSAGGSVELDGDARILGRRYDVQQLVPGMDLFGWSSRGGYGFVWQFVRMSLLALLFFLAFAVVGGRLEVVLAHARAETARDLGWGLLWLPLGLGGLVLATAALLFSVIGIPVAVLLVPAAIAVALLAFAVGCHRLGERVGPGGPRWLVALLGAAIVEIPALITNVLFLVDGHLPAAVIALTLVNLLLRAAVLALGLGALVATRAGQRAGGIQPGTLPGAAQGA